MNRAGRVFVQNTYAGRIYETDEGYAFEYDSSYISQDNAVAVSMTLPLSSDFLNRSNDFVFSFILSIPNNRET